MAMARQGKIEVSEAARQKYLDSLYSQLRELRNSMERSDFGEVREICHKIRGSAGLYGLQDLGDACGEVEDACVQGGDPERIVAGFQVIEVLIYRGQPSAEAS